MAHLEVLPGMLSRFSTRDTWLTRNFPGVFFRLDHLRHVAHSQCSRDAHSVRALGTRGSLARYPESAWGVNPFGVTRDTWRTRNAPGEISRLGSRDTWCTRVAQNGFKTHGAILGRRIRDQWLGLVCEDRTGANSLGGFKSRDSSGPSDQRWM